MIREAEAQINLEARQTLAGLFLRDLLALFAGL